MIVITTPTGGIGSQVLQNVLTSGEEVRVIVRDAKKIPELLREKIEIVEGSIEDAEVLNRAFSGADAVFWIVPPRDAAPDLYEHYMELNKLAANTAKKNGVKNLVWISTAGTDLGTTSGHLSAAKEADKPLIDTGISARILDPVTFMDNLIYAIDSLRKEGSFSWTINPDNVFNNVATRDIAAAASHFLINQDWSGQKHIPLFGPDDLTPNEMSEIMSDVLGKKIRYKQINDESYKSLMMQYGSSDSVAQGLVDMAKAQNQGVYLEQGKIVSRTSTDFRTWCEEVLKPAFING